MAEFGCYKMSEVRPERTWTADYMTLSGGLIRFWDRASTADQKDILVAVVFVERGHTVSAVESTKVEPELSVYKAIFDQAKQEPVYDLYREKSLAAPSE